MLRLADLRLQLVLSSLHTAAGALAGSWGRCFGALAAGGFYAVTSGPGASFTQCSVETTFPPAPENLLEPLNVVWLCQRSLPAALLFSFRY